MSDFHVRQCCRQQAESGAYMVAALMGLTLQWRDEKYFYCDKCYEGSSHTEQKPQEMHPIPVRDGRRKKGSSKV